MSFFEFPHTRTYDCDLGWLIKAMKVLQTAMETFVAANSLTFADPLLHSILSEYNKNTIVLDPAGNAYLSHKKVPEGIQLSNTEYWLMIFDYEAFLEKVNKNFTGRYYRNTNRATSPMIVGDWLTFDDVLCKVTAPIAIDDVLAVGVNIEHFTLEDFIKSFMTSATQLIQQYKNDIDASELAYRQQLAQDIANTTSSLQAQLDLAISGVTVDSEVINARLGEDDVTYSTLGDSIRTQFENAYKLNNITDCLTPITFSTGYITTNVDPVDPTNPITSGTWVHSVIPCSEGDVFIINCDGTVIPRAYAFVDSTNTRITVATSSTSYSYQKIVAPAGTAYLVLNKQTSRSLYPSYAASSDLASIDAITKNFINVITSLDEITEISFSTGYITTNIDPVNPTNPITSGTWVHSVIPCSEGDVFIINCDGTVIPRAYAFVDSTNTRIKVAPDTTSFSYQKIVAPAGTAYLVLNKQTSRSLYPSYKIGAISNINDHIINIDATLDTGFTFTKYAEEQAVIDAVLLDKDINTVTFVAIADSHYWSANHALKSINQGVLAQRVAKKTGADFIIHLGDVIEGGASTHSVNKQRLAKYWSTLNNTDTPILYTLAHHEQYGQGGQADWYDDSTACTVADCMGLYGYMSKYLDVVYSNDKTTWYCDIKGVRFIGVNSTSPSGALSFSTDNIDFVISALNSTTLPVILFSHAPSASGVNWNNDGIFRGNLIEEALNNYSGDVAAYIHGHVHWDNIYKYPANKFPYYSVCCSVPSQTDISLYGCDDGNPVNYTRTLGTWSEYCFDVFNYHKDTGIIRSFRYGAGTNRSYTPN